MFATQAYTVLSILAGASLANAHGYVFSWTFNGEVHEGVNPNSGGGGYSGAQRPLDNSEANGNGWGPSNFPVTEFPAKMVCGGMSAGSGLDTWDLEAGTEVTAQWTGAKNGQTGWPTEHHGPALEYMARCPSDDCNGVAADSLDWFKIGEDSWDGSGWPSDKIRSGQDWTFKIPADIAPGAYLVRHEQMALHWAYGQEAGKGFEVYPHCFQAKVSGSGSAVPTDTVRIPDIYTPEQYPMYKFAVATGGKSTWGGESLDSYVPPGGPVYTGGAASGPAPSGSANPTSVAAPIASATIPTDDENTAPTDVEALPSATESAELPESTDESTEGSPDESTDESTDVPEETDTPSGEEPAESTPAPAPTSEAAATSTRASRTRTRWRWRSVSTQAAKSDVSRRNVIARYAPRQIGIVA